MSAPQSPLNFDNFNAVRGPVRQPKGFWHRMIVNYLIGVAIGLLARKYWHHLSVRVIYCTWLAAGMAALPAILLVALVGLVWVFAMPGYTGWPVPATAFGLGGALWLRLSFKWTRGLLRNNGTIPKRTRPRP